MTDSFRELPVVSAGPNLHRPGQTVPILGIDLGTTNSLVAIVQNGQPQIIPLASGSKLLPSVVRFLEDGSHQVGQIAKQTQVQFSATTVSSAKRFLGRGGKDVSNSAPSSGPKLNLASEKNISFEILGQSHTPIEISALILRSLKDAAETHLGQELEDAVITVPAYFNDSQRQATRAAGRLAGLNVLRILNEPTAAALAYGLQKKKNGVIAVYDLGGGTFDISILRLQDGIFEVLATNGDTALGGNDMDAAIARWIANSLSLPIDPVSSAGTASPWTALLECAEKLKIQLGSLNGATNDATDDLSATLRLEEQSYSIRLSAKELNALLEPVLVKTKGPVMRAIEDAKISSADITDVVLVGGPTRLKCLRDFARELFGREPNVSLNPDETVALGAAIQADILAGNNSDLLLLDVVPLSLGIETFGGTMSALVPRNTRIPTMAKEQFTTYVEGQTKVAINVFQGERELVSENRKLGEFVLSGIPPLPAGLARVDVTFLVDADGILSVSAKELYSGVEQNIEVKPTYGLDDAQVEKMLAAGIENRDKDATVRRLIEARNDANVVLQATERALQALGNTFPDAERAAVLALVLDLKKALEGNSAELVKSAQQALNQGTQHMAELLMSHTLSSSVKNARAQDFLKK